MRPKYGGFVLFTCKILNLASCKSDHLFKPFSNSLHLYPSLPQLLYVHACLDFFLSARWMIEAMHRTSIFCLKRFRFSLYVWGNVLPAHFEVGYRWVAFVELCTLFIHLIHFLFCFKIPNLSLKSLEPTFRAFHVIRGSWSLFNRRVG